MNARDSLDKDSNTAEATSSGIEVKEVDFSEFDRRQKASEAKSYIKYERRGFIGEVDSLIQEIYI